MGEIEEKRELTEGIEQNRKKKKAATTALVAILCIGSCLGAGASYALYHKYQKVSEEYRLLQAEKEKQIQQEVGSRLEEERDAKGREMMDLFREGLGKDNHTLTFLRELYGEDYLVYQQAQNYLFRPLLDVEMADYSDGSFQIEEATGFRCFKTGEKKKTKNIIDVSKYQGEIDWKAVREAGVDGVMIRVGVRGYGSGEIVADTYFEKNIQGALKEGLEAGVYFFSEAVSMEEAVEEAEFVLDTIKPYKMTLPVTFDLEKIAGDTGRNESLSMDEMTEVTLAFMETIEEAGYEPMLYGNIETISEMIDLKALEQYKLWFAYYSEELYVPYKIDMWQYASDGKVAGISTECDVNMMFVE